MPPGNKAIPDRPVRGVYVDGDAYRIDGHRLTHGAFRRGSLRFDFNRAQQVRIPYDALGLLQQQREILDPLIPDHNRHGIVLICAPPGQGLTTTGYALLSCHDSYTSNVRSLEMETEAILEGTVQQVWDPTNPQVDYARTLQSMLRRDPDVIL
ncbi:MAG: Flp pilus assembly complex ATPase component, partial [Planctomycetaceae bacterium]|nr:Flp pilus assembly complex ATPase component [Planctomycetaceae bacterium]